MALDISEILILSHLNIDLEVRLVYYYVFLILFLIFNNIDFKNFVQWVLTIFILSTDASRSTPTFLPISFNFDFFVPFI